MFVPFPKFENLPLRLKVQWSGRSRSIVAHLERWPNAGEAFIICNFEDDMDTGRWIIMENDKFYIVKRPDRWLEQKKIRNENGEIAEIRTEFKISGRAKLSALIERAFAGSERFHLDRITTLADLPREPRYVLESENGWHWLSRRTQEFHTPFATPGMTPQTQNACEVQQKLQLAWEDSQSDARFAWHFATLDVAEKIELLSGSDEDKREIQTLMKLILQSTPTLWQSGNFWGWRLTFDDQTTNLNSQPLDKHLETQLLIPWTAILRRHCYGNWGQRAFENHACAREFWGNKSRYIGYAQQTSAPNFHDQLEAKLQLRDWLQDKATPAEIEQFLAQ